LSYARTECTGSPGTSDFSGRVTSQCHQEDISAETPIEHNGTLPSGVTNPGGACGHWWTILDECDDNRLGAIIYWDGPAWKMKLYCSEDAGATYSSLGDATLSNVECGCAGISFDWSMNGVECVCCESLCCDPDPATITVSDGTNSVILTNNGVGEWTGSGTLGSCEADAIPEDAEWSLTCNSEADPNTMSFQCDNCDTPVSISIASWSCDPFEATAAGTGCLTGLTLTFTE